MTVGGGSSPHSVLTMRSMPTTRPASASSSVSRARGLAPPTSTGVPVGTGDLERAEDSEAHAADAPRTAPSAAPLSARDGPQVAVQVGCKYPARGDGDSGSRPDQTRGAAAAAPRGNPLMSIDRSRPRARPTFDDAVLDTLAPAIPAADVDDLRSQVHGPVYAAGDDGLAAEVATWNVAIQHTPADRGGRHLRRRRRRRRLLGGRARPAGRRPGHRARAGPQRRRLDDDHHPPHAGPAHRPRAPHRPRRGRRQVDPRDGGRRRVRAGRAVRVVVRRRRRRLHPRRRAWARSAASTASPPTT